MTFAGKVVIVTGASSGIGAATALMFCREGASVALVGRNKEKLRAVSEQCAKAGGRHLIIIADVASDVDAKKIIFQTISQFGKIDILINNAGIAQYGSILGGTALKAYDGVMSVNLRAAIQMTCLAAPYLVKTKGSIVNVSSVASQSIISGETTAYCVSKAGLSHFTKGAAMELAASGVRVNAVSPGPVVTDLLENAASPVTWDHMLKLTALGRVSEGDEVADLILYLASDKAVGITGSDYVIDNGCLVK